MFGFNLLDFKFTSLRSIAGAGVLSAAMLFAGDAPKAEAGGFSLSIGGFGPGVAVGRTGFSASPYGYSGVRYGSAYRGVPFNSGYRSYGPAVYSRSSSLYRGYSSGYRGYAPAPRYDYRVPAYRPGFYDPYCPRR